MPSAWPRISPAGARDLFGELNAEPTEFDGYDVLKETAKVLALSDGEELNDAVSTDYEERENVLVVLDRTPFYAEMGGQVADHGYLTSGTANLKVNQVKKDPQRLLCSHLHPAGRHHPRRRYRNRCCG